MKTEKIFLAIVIILSLFFFDNINAQNSAQGSGQSFEVSVYVNAPYYCPNHGIITGYITILGHSVKEYLGSFYNPYQLYWEGTFGNYQSCTIEVITDSNSQGDYCHGLKIKDVSVNDNNVYVNIDLIGVGGSGDDEE